MSSASVLADARERARALDRDDALAFTRSEFNIPSKSQIASTRLPNSGVTVPFSDWITVEYRC